MHHTLPDASVRRSASEVEPISQLASGVVHCLTALPLTHFSSTGAILSPSFSSVLVGGPSQLVLDEVTLPAPQPNEVLIELHVAGVNYVDTYFRAGLYKLPLPAIIGREAAGTITAIGSGVSNLAVGDRVVFFAPGAYATHAVVDAGAVVRITDGLSFQQAAAAHVQGLTAQSFITSVYPVKTGDIVLIHAAAGGTGNLMVQMCKIRGATSVTHQAACRATACTVLALTRCSPRLLSSLSSLLFLLV